MSALRKIDFLLKRYLKIPIFKVFCFFGVLLSPLVDKETRKEKISNILVFQGGGIGDVIRIFPSIRLLNEEFSRASITVLCPFGPGFFELFSHSHVISEHIIFDVSGKHKSISSKLSLIRALRKRSFDLILCPQIGMGMIEFAVMSFLMRVPYRVGYDMHGSGFLYTSKIALQETKSVYEQHCALLKGAGIGVGDCKHSLKEPYVTIPEKDISFAHSFLRDQRTSHNNLIFTISPIVMADRDNKSPQHDRPLASLRNWPEHKYIDLINEIIHSYRAKVIILGDRIPQGHLSDFLIKTDSPDVISAINKTTLGQSAALISLSRIFIGNDTGLLHIALALKKPCIGIFGSTSPEQVIPSVDYCIPVWAGIECSPCFVHQPVPDFKCNHEMQCLRSISVEDVMTAVKQLAKS